MPPKRFSGSLDTKLKLIRSIIGDNVVFAIGVSEGNKVNILRAQRVFFPPKESKEFAEEEVNKADINNNPIKEYVG